MNQEQYEIDREFHDSMDGELTGDAGWIHRARTAFEDSTDYYESSLYNNWRSNLAHFRSEHAPGSKYHSPSYKHRSKLFRPKPRAAVRTLDATAAAALFTNDDLINVRGVDENNAEQAAAAKLHKAILQHRLEVTIPWFLTSLGAYQDTNVYGICVSKQYWDYRVRHQVSHEIALDEMGQPMMDEDGVLLGYEQTNKEVIADKPVVNLIAPDNFRFDPNSDWRDPVSSSPYLIEMIPMYALDVTAMMGDEDSPTDPATWKPYPLPQVVAAGRERNSESTTVNDARQGKGREDSREIETMTEYTPIWVHFNILRGEDGEDWAFYTVGTQLLLTDPVPLKEMYPHGRDMYRVGFSSLETHRTHPSGVVELSRPLTEAGNDTANQRMDNVRLVLNKRYAIRRGAKIDLGALMRNVPGGGVMMDNVREDYAIMDTPDVTQSSYVEQDRISVETDELLGTFSQASVQTNRALNETVGGMDLMSGSANQVQELGLRTFIETWVEPVLRTLIKLEGLYETDEHVLALAAGTAEVEVDDSLLMQDLVVKVNVGMGNTNPKAKLQRFLEPLNAAAQFPEFVAELDFLELGKEVFALAGMGDGARFMLTDEKKQMRAEQSQGQQDPRIAVEEMRMQARQMELEIRQMESEQDGILKQMEIQSRQEVDMAKLAATEKIKLTELYERLGMERESTQVKAQLDAARVQAQRDIAALRSKYDQLKMALKTQNMQMGYDSFG